jgi:hypothetical protein
VDTSEVYDRVTLLLGGAVVLLVLIVALHVSNRL